MDMKNYLKYELSPIPLSLFTENGFRKNVKSQMYDQFTSTEFTLTVDDIVHVIDGGYFLNKVVWQKNDTSEEIVQKYLTYVQNNYAKNSCFVFDGYVDNDCHKQNLNVCSTKTSERLRRKHSLTSPAFLLEPHTKVTVTQQSFLSNDKNKNELIKQLSKALTFEGYSVKQAEEDADLLIVDSAITIAEQLKVEDAGATIYKKTVVIIGQDIDLLVLLNQLNNNNAPIYFMKAGSVNVNDIFYSSNSFNFEQYRSIVAFLHCFTGCDTTSGFAGKGKKKTLELLMNTNNLKELVEPFYDPRSNKKTIARNGCKLIASIYQCPNPDMSLDDLRFHRYKVLTSKSTFRLEKLPPTVGAGSEHSYRVYHQLQLWCDKKLDPTKWGWKQELINNCKVLMPCFTNIPVIPEELIKQISCSCETDCSKNRCGCRKHGLKCTDLCSKCQDSEHCSNLEINVQDFSDCDEFEESSDPCDSESRLVEDTDDVENEGVEAMDLSDDENENISICKKPRLQ